MSPKKVHFKPLTDGMSICQGLFLLVGNPGSGNYIRLPYTWYMLETNVPASYKNHGKIESGYRQGK
mgnify:FL=1